MYVSFNTTFSASVYTQKIYFNIPKNKTFLTKRCNVKCTHYCINNHICWWSGSDILSILYPNMIVCYLHIGILLYFNYVLRKWLGGFLVEVTHYIFLHSKCGK